MYLLLSEVAEIKEYVKIPFEVWQILIPSVVSIIGFFLTYKLAKRTIKDEISKMQKARMIDNGTEILDFFADILSGQAEHVDVNSIKQLRKTICSYGSKDLTKLFASYQQFTYNMKLNSEEEKNETSVKTFAYVCLLITQIKYDIIGEVANPMYYLKMMINDYNEKNSMISSIEIEIKKMVKEFKLNSDIVKEMSKN